MQPLRRGFTTLSEALGRTLQALHASLLSAIATERTASVMPALLRAMTALVHGSPYQRMQPGLLLLIVQVWNLRFAILCSTH